MKPYSPGPLFIASLFLLIGSADRADGYPSACGGNKVRHTVYNLPDEDKPETWGDHKSFKAAVHMQGSGSCGTKPSSVCGGGASDKKMINYQNKVTTRPDTCKTTTTSASGKCLLTYFSIAADKTHFKMGDVVFIPAMVGLKVKMPDGTEFEHPGYFVVHDVGGAIKGGGRFDFFVGSQNYKKNAFTEGKKSNSPYLKSSSPTINLGDPTKCDLDYTVLNGRDAQDAMRTIAKYQSDDESLKSTIYPDGSHRPNCDIYHPDNQAECRAKAMSEAGGFR